MTEEEWLHATPPLMMQHIQQTAPASARRLRLLAVAYARFLETQPDYADADHVSHLGEEVAEGRVALDGLFDQRVRGAGGGRDWRIANLVLAGDEAIDMVVRKAMHYSEEWGRQAGLDVADRRPTARSLIRCVLGNPFHPAAIEPRWLTPTVVGIAGGIYEERAFDRLPLLAGALEDAGCDDPEVLGHCRCDLGHARGCWVVDQVLGKV